MRFLIFLIVLFILSANKASAESFMYFLGESFTWQQSEDFADTGGRRKNQGILYGIGAIGKWNLPSKFTLKVTTELKGNRFDRETVEFLMIDDTVEFLMIKVTGDVGWRFPVTASLSLEPFIGFGYRRWIRDAEEYKAFSGYTQTWRSHYGKIGVEAEYSSSKSIKNYINAGAILPTGSRMKRNKGGETCRANFNSRPSFFSEIGVIYKRLLVGAYYEGIRFPVSRDTCGGLTQPESKADMFGIKLGVKF